MAIQIVSEVQTYLNGLNHCLEELSQQEDKIENAARIIFESYRKGGWIFVLGNGGSASTASHCALGFAKQSAVAGKPRLKSKSLADNIGLITAWGNDESFESVFLQQLINELEPQDVVIGISASGNSPNVLRAMNYATSLGAKTIGFTGFGGGRLQLCTDCCITLTCKDYGQVEDAHLALTHILSGLLKERIAHV